ncbi:hypothetical protein KN815_17740, partial [Streptomyces sp. 4503]|nr:hypothetical protein [Streptomyces niphimycinicus]
MRNKKRHKRSRVIGLTVVGVTALAVGGGALLMTDNDASAARRSAGQQAPARAALTVKCPDAATRLSSVPQQARPTVDKELATMDSQVADAYQQLATRGASADQDWVRTRVLEPLSAKRRGALNRIGNEIGRMASRPSGLDTLASCTVQQAAPAAAPAGATSAPAGAT